MCWTLVRFFTVCASVYCLCVFTLTVFLLSVRLFTVCLFFCLCLYIFIELDWITSRIFYFLRKILIFFAWLLW